MILYDWECEKCGEQFEYITHSYVNETTCPHCRGLARKIITRISPFQEPENKRKWGTSFYRETPKRKEINK